MIHFTRGTWLLAALLLFSIPFYGQENKPGLNGPLLEFDSDTFNFGEVELNGKHEFEIKFRNAGNEPLIISDVKSGDPHYGVGPREPIKPGATAFIKLYVPTDYPRRVDKALYIFSNSVVKPQYVLKIIGTVLKGPEPSNGPGESCAHIKFEKDTFDLGELQYGSGGHFQLEFINDGNLPLILSEVNYSEIYPPSLPKDPVPPHMGGHIDFYYNTKRVGAFQKKLTVKSNSKPYEVTILLVKGVVLGPKKTGK